MGAEAGLLLPVSIEGDAELCVFLGIPGDGAMLLLGLECLELAAGVGIFDFKGFDFASGLGVSFGESGSLGEGGAEFLEGGLCGGLLFLEGLGVLEGFRVGGLEGLLELWF